MSALYFKSNNRDVCLFSVTLSWSLELQIQVRTYLLVPAELFIKFRKRLSRSLLFLDTDQKLLRKQPRIGEYETSELVYEPVKLCTKRLQFQERNHH